VTRVVLDASAAVEIALDTPRGLRLASHLPKDGEVVAPDHFFGEAGAALRRMENHGDLSADRATLALRRIQALRIRRVSTRGLLPVAWRLRRNLTIGDGLYVALGQRLDVTLVTADDRLSRAPAFGIKIIT
jgi:predicted nucleic acid-binding protein